MTEVVPRPVEEKLASPPASRLESWKEIAAYLNRGVRTVQRWERTEALPVYRHRHDKRGTVYALRQEVEDWRAKRTEMANRAAAGSVPEAGGYWSALAGRGARVAAVLRQWIPLRRNPRRTARTAALILFSLAIIVVWVESLGGAS